MVNSFAHSVAPGTSTNRATQARAYITFAVHYQFQPLYPTGRQLCMYAQFLINSFSAPTSVKNYLSGARTWIAQHGGVVSAFTSFEYQQMHSGITKRSTHNPSRAVPLEWHHIASIAAFFDASPVIPLSAKTCVLVGYHTFLRSSNLLAPSGSSWGGPHTLRAQDLQLSDQGLEITIYSTKTKTDPKPSKTIIPWGPDPALCPVASWLKYSTTVKPWVLGPAFISDNGRALTARQLVGLIRLALCEFQDISPARVSMHSLRRGATQSALRQGLSLEQIKERGMWRSNSGVAPYLQ